MALINCPECKKEVSEKAQTCPHCGFQLRDDDLPRKPKKVNGCLSVLIIAVVLISVMFFLGIFSDGSSTDNSTSTNKFLAYDYAEQFVKKELKSPSTADFPGFSEKKEHISDMGGGRYKISSWVDSQNSFGAQIRTSFSCIIIFDGENVRCEQLHLE